MCLFLLLRRVVPPWRRGPPATRDQTVRLVLEFGGGLALLAYAAWQLPGDAREDQAYRSEWGCRQGTQLAIGSNQGACSVHKASLSAHLERGSKGDESYFLDIDAWATGNRQSVEIAPTEANYDRLERSERPARERPDSSNSSTAARCWFRPTSAQSQPKIGPQTEWTSANACGARCGPRRSEPARTANRQIHLAGAVGKRAPERV